MEARDGSISTFSDSLEKTQHGVLRKPSLLLQEIIDGASSVQQHSTSEEHATATHFLKLRICGTNGSLERTSRKRRVSRGRLDRSIFIAGCEEHWSVTSLRLAARAASGQLGKGL